MKVLFWGFGVEWAQADLGMLVCKECLFFFPFCNGVVFVFSVLFFICLWEV